MALHEWLNGHSKPRKRVAVNFISTALDRLSGFRPSFLFFRFGRSVEIESLR